MEDETAHLRCWNECSPDILLMIFEHLDVRSLIKCLTINKRWRHIAERICRKVGWKAIAELGLHNRAAHLLNTTLGWRDMVMNTCLWSLYEEYGCNVTKLNEYEVPEFVLKSYIYKDDLVIVDKDSVTYYNANNFKISKKRASEYYHYAENDYMAANITYNVWCSLTSTRKLLYLHGKPCTDAHQSQSARHTRHRDVERCTTTITDCSNWETLHLTEDVCYIMQWNGAIHAHKWNGNNWTETLHARHFGTPDKIYVLYKYRNTLYGLSKSDSIWRVNSSLMQVKKVCPLQLPYHITPELTVAVFYYICSVVYEHGVIQTEVLDEFYDNLVFNDLSCAKFYGGMIFLGDAYGKVMVCKPKYLARSKVFDIRIQEICNVSNFLSNSERSPAVFNLDIYEDHNSHHLFIYTHKNICHVKLKPRHVVFNEDNA